MFKRTTRLTNEEFERRARKIFTNNEYDYSKVRYVNRHTKVTIICNTCGNEFEKTPSNHMTHKQGCPICSKKNKRHPKQLTTKQFINKAKKIHGSNTYDYRNVQYVNTNVKVLILCLTCRTEFQQSPGHHLIGQGCPKCKNKASSDKRRLTKEQFVDKAQKIHNNLYSYDSVKYVNHMTKVQIFCNRCKTYFNQTPNSHLRGQGCSACNRRSKYESKNVGVISDYLHAKNIHFVREKTFQTCRNQKKLPFDFYIPEHNLLIEYDGEQHFKPIKFFGGRKALKLIKQNDAIKNQWAIDNGIYLIHIRYDEDVEIKLDAIFGTK